MSEQRALDDRLRAALGGDGAAGYYEARAAIPQSAKSDLLARVRRHRTRRLQAAGVACAVVLGLALGIPQVLGGTPVRPKAAAGRVYGPAIAGVVAASCSVDGGPASQCGELVKGTPLYAQATGAGDRAAFPMKDAAAASPLDVKAGSSVLVALPTKGGRWRWTTPTVVGAPGVQSHSRRSAASVRPVRSRGAAQEFRVTANAPGTVLLEGQAHPVFHGAAPSMLYPDDSVWTLVLHINQR